MQPKLMGCGLRATPLTWIVCTRGQGQLQEDRPPLRHPKQEDDGRLGRERERERERERRVGGSGQKKARKEGGRADGHEGGFVQRDCWNAGALIPIVPTIPRESLYHSHPSPPLPSTVGYVAA
jgi:hypothetical protein